jgi:hypothetical protein
VLVNSARSLKIAGWAVADVQTKICEQCHGRYPRPQGDRRVSEPKWKAQRFCSHRCAHYDRRPARPSRDTLANIATAHSTNLLLDALLSYGWRHNGLPGLSADCFFALAKERGVAA